MLNKKNIVILFLMLLSVFAFAQSSLTERYLTGANDKLAAGDYEKSFNYINYVLNSYDGGELPVNVEIVAEEVYYAYLGQLKQNYDAPLFSLIKSKLSQHQVLNSERIKLLVFDIENRNMPATSVSGAALSAIPQIVQQGLSDKQLETILNAEREKQEHFLSVMSEQQEKNVQNQQSVFESLLGKSEAMTRENTKAVLSTVILVLGVCLAIFAILIVFVLINQKNAKKQQEQFNETLKVVAQLARIPQERGAFDALPAAMLGNSMLLGDNHVGTASEGLPPPQVSESELAALRKLASTCETIGVQIDTATGRKNNSKNVAELVYKLCMQMGIPTAESMLYFAAAMIYDIGFLSLDSSVLQADRLNDEQMYQVRNHVNAGVARLEFVPAQYKNVFTDAVLMHHENIDGSGYPAGISGEKIPLVARIIHIAESFVSMISKRNYRSIFDKESALSELHQMVGSYDATVLKALEQII